MAFLLLFWARSALPSSLATKFSIRSSGSIQP
jgi:hypothetical protein